ncbi:MAG TPA: hypothetical protein VIV60_13690, partial [Polyangiaceae bacterium]
LLLHYGTKDDPGLMLIDGGPSKVYGPQLKPRLNAIREARGLEDHESLPIDLLMVSHVDDDHIQGILDLTSELATTSGTRYVEIANFWHNTFDDVIGNDPKELTSAFTAQFGPAALTMSFSEDELFEAKGANTVTRETAKILASIEQGHRLRGNIKALKAELNAEFKGKLILASSDIFEFDAGLTFVVAGPMVTELRALQKKHDQWLESHKEDESDEVPAAYADKSVPNLSSIVVFAQCKGKSILLTGDARGDKILEGLEEVGVLQAGKAIDVDVLKVPHHGSSNNLETDFFERIRAKHYVFSGNGEHGNPERETLGMLLDARGQEPFTIHLTYPVSDIDDERKKDWLKEQSKEVTRAAKNPEKTVRENWSPKKHSLTAFFEQRPLAEGQELVINDGTTPHVIDLVGHLGY